MGGRPRPRRKSTAARGRSPPAPGPLRRQRDRWHHALSAAMKTHHLPIVVAGQRVETGELRTFEYGNVAVTLPRLTEAHVQTVFSTPGSCLTDVSIDDIVLFFDKVGRQWTHPDNVWRRTAIELLAHSVGYARSTLTWDINFIGGILQRQKLYDLLDSDLGDAGLLDEFTRHKAVNRRCFPLGKLLNILVGNVPI